MKLPYCSHNGVGVKINSTRDTRLLNRPKDLPITAKRIEFGNNFQDFQIQNLRKIYASGKLMSIRTESNGR
jgi:hypothetical protein